MTRPRVASVSYLNAKPLIEGLEQDAEVFLDVPSRLLSGLAASDFDVALLPVADVPRLPGARVIPAGGIGCDGPTLTVRIFSDTPLRELSVLYVDTDSHTSINLARVILRETYGREVRLVPITRDARPLPHGATLLIGDKVINDAPSDAEKPIQLDLGEAWKSLTGMPFVFAVWTARAGVDVTQVEPLLRAARERGEARIDDIVAKYAPIHRWPAEVARTYLTRYLRFEIGPRQLEAMQLFWNKAGLTSVG